MGKKVIIPSRGIRGLTGVTTYILENARRLHDLGHHVVLYAEEFDVARVGATGCVPKRVWRPPFGRYFRRRFFAQRFDRYLERERFDIVFGQGDVFTQHVLSLHDCVHRVHEAIHGHPMARDTSVAAIHRKVLTEQRFDCCIANSQLMKDDITRRFGVSPDKMRVIHPGYDPTHFTASHRQRNRAQYRQSLGLKEDDVLVGIITSGAFAKRGVDLLFRALPKVPPRSRDRLHVVVIGKDRHAQDYLKIARSAGIAQRVRFLPPTPEVYKYYYALDIYAYPARFDEFGISVLEAMACGIPVVTSRMVGATELYPREAADFLLDMPNEEGIAHRLARLVDDADLRNRCGRWGIQAAACNTWDDSFKSTVEVLRAHGL